MIKILTDASSDITKNFLTSKHLDIIPIQVSHKENLITDMQLNDFYKLLETTDEFPKTSQISPEVYMDYFKKYKNDEIIYISLSSKLSGTFSSANLAKQLLEDEFDTSNIYLIDSEVATIQLAILVKLAIDLVKKGKTVKEIVDILEENKKKVRVRAIVDDLEYLYKGGRLSRTSATIGTALNIKPVLEIKNGEIKVVTKARGLKKANKVILDELKEKMPENIVIGYGTKWDSYEAFKSQIEIPYEELQIGKIIGTHLGSKCYAIAYLEK